MIDRERALGQPRRMFGVNHRSGAAPSRAIDHGDEAVVRVIVGQAEAAGLELVDVDIEAGPVRIAVENGLVGRGLVGRIAPGKLIGRLVDHGRRVDLGGVARGRKASGRRDDGRELETQQGDTVRHLGSHSGMSPIAFNRFS
jgi:hypothetical protein